MAMALHALANDLALNDVERREQSRDTMALVVMGYGGSAPLFHRQTRLGTIKGLNLALLVDRQDDRVCVRGRLSGARSARGAALQGVAGGGGRANVRGPMRLAIAGLSGGVRDRRVLSRQRPAAPSSRKRCCQRQITVLALPVACMISAVPRPLAVRSTIFARQTCFCGLLRLATTASSLLRAAWLK